MRIYNSNAGDANILLIGEARAHLAALRAHTGDEVSIFKGDGIDYVYSVFSESKRGIELKLIRNKTVNNECKRSVTLFMSIISRDKFLLAVQKAVELGVKCIVPVSTKYSQHNIHISNEKIIKTCIAACEQCERAVIPEAKEEITFKKMCDSISDFDKFVFGYERAKSGSVKSIISPSHNNIAFFVGSEGGISPEEVELLQANKAYAVTFGKRILRAETAAITGLSLINDALGEI